MTGPMIARTLTATTAAAGLALATGVTALTGCQTEPRTVHEHQRPAPPPAEHVEPQHAPPPQQPTQPPPPPQNPDAY